jgi:two-component system NtrC family response regulator
MLDEHKTVLVVDDDASVIASLSLLLKQAGFRILSAESPAVAMSLITDHAIDLIITDMNFSRQTTGDEGLALLKEIRARLPQVPVILITAWGSISLAVQGVKAGASDFITKPWDNAHLLKVIRTSLTLAGSGPTETLSREELDERYDFASIVGQHPGLLNVLGTVGRVAQTDAPVLILGESGTGKELIADAIHRNSHRSAGPLVKVNLGGIGSSLFESEMFGHVKGAFTDAKSNREGRFAVAEAGTILLDEVGDLDKSSQVKLLRVLQDQTYQPVGSSQTLRANVRVIAATNRDLKAMVEDGDFREDLLYRLNLITIRVPSLRERRADIPLIAHHYLQRLSRTYGADVFQLEPLAMYWLQGLAWPGNVRQLCQNIERAVLMSGKKRLAREDFADPEFLAERPATPDPMQTDGLTLEEIEKVSIEHSLSRFEGNISQAARALGLSRAALYRRMDKHGIAGPVDADKL